MNLEGADLAKMPLGAAVTAATNTATVSYPNFTIRIYVFLVNYPNSRVPDELSEFRCPNFRVPGAPPEFCFPNFRV